MALELSLSFPDPTQVLVRLTGDGGDAPPQPFTSPLIAADQQELRWYLEVYPTQYTTEVDDGRAARLEAQLPRWGEALFTTVFQRREAARLMDRFQEQAEAERQLTINSAHPAVLGQPWELLRDPSGTYLFLEPVAIRRRLVGAGGGRRPFTAKPKPRLHLLFVVSRPTGSAFLDPRSDAQAVLDALEAQALGRVTVECLRPATLSHLRARLRNKDLPQVDILHFDGHGAYEVEGSLADVAARTMDAAGRDSLIRRQVGAPGPQGYLLFEAEDGSAAPVPAALFGDLLHRQRVGLVVLSACESAMVGGEDPMGSVAARLLHAGLPAVLAMTHTVLVPTTRTLFEAFYGELARGQPIGAALDDARGELYAHPERVTQQRGPQRVPISLQDWFVPALYQAGRDTALLTRTRGTAPAPAPWGNLPEVQESGFHGRRRELWALERAFVRGTRRLVVHGFGGQGKTALALEAGRWLHRTGLFTRVCFVSYANFQGVDPVSLTVSTLATVLDRSLLDAAAATAALTDLPTLLILDNLETLGPEPRRELLDAAVPWSEAGTSRVLLTTRQPDLHHPAYPTQESLRCQYLELAGLAPEDALAWVQALMRLPPPPQVPLPAAEALTTLFANVGFHPLSVGVLARELKRRRIAALGERLEALLQGTESPLLASLNLSLERLAPEMQPWLPRLGVFQGGAFEDDLLTITEIPQDQWPALRQGLEATGLVQVEAVPGCNPPFLRFHPTLAPALWGRLAPEAQAAVTGRYRQLYYQLSDFLLQQDRQQHVQAIRAIARRELPNLLAAVDGALAAGEPWAVDFADKVNWFLKIFGRHRDEEQLTARAQAAAAAVGSEAWYLARSNQGVQLFDAGRVAKAEAVFQEILAQLGEPPSYQRSLTLLRLGRCYQRQGQAAQAKALIRQALAEATPLASVQAMRQLIGTLQIDLGILLFEQGEYAAARAAYEAALAIDEELGDQHGAAVIRTNLGALALRQGALPEAEQRYSESLETFQALQEPAGEAGAWHQLGRVYQAAGEWDDAERAYREAAQINERIGNRVEAAATWSQLAQVMAVIDQDEAAEAWYRKALDSHRATGNRAGEARILHNLAALLWTQPERLTEARTCVESALAIKETMDPAAAQIWTTYVLLAEIATAEGRSQEARTFRRQAREAWTGFRGAWAEVRRHAPLIADVLTVVADPGQRPALEEHLDALNTRGWGNLIAAIRRVLDGERDPDGLCAALNWEEMRIILVILQGLDHPDMRRALFAAATKGKASPAPDTPDMRDP